MDVSWLAITPHQRTRRLEVAYVIIRLSTL
jgi:hypothetical protein